MEIRRDILWFGTGLKRISGLLLITVILKVKNLEVILEVTDEISLKTNKTK